MQAGPLDPARTAERARRISAAAETMAAHIAELLDAARLRAGQPLQLARHPTDLVALARRVAAQVQETTQRHTLEVEAAGPHLVGAWDAPRLERVRGNLLGRDR